MKRSGSEVHILQMYSKGGNGTILTSSNAMRTVERGSLGPVLKSSTVARKRHLATVLELMPSSLLNYASLDFGCSLSAQMACEAAALARQTCPLCFLPVLRNRSHRHTIRSNSALRLGISIDLYPILIRV